MLTADMVRARRRQGRLELVSLTGRRRGRAVELAGAYLEVARSRVGERRLSVDQAIAEVPIGARERKLAAGLRKMVLDRCVIEADESVDARALRREVFELAAAARRALGSGLLLDRGAIVEEAAGRLDLAPAQLEANLFADLREAQLLRAAPSVGADALVSAYELAQEQAVLLRAVELCARVRCSSPAQYRSLFRELKFRRLLCTIEAQGDGGYAIRIDGPLSLFSSVTKYGLALALVLPEIRRCDEWSIEATVRWGKTRQPLTFARAGTGTQRDEDGDGAERLPEEVARLLVRLNELDTPWRASVATELLTLPGLGTCVPDLMIVNRETGEVAFVEVLGFWSRDAVWRRVELVRAGLPQRIIFAVSRRLRVSEAVLEEDLPGELYVYRGTMSAKTIIERLERSPSR